MQKLKILPFLTSSVVLSLSIFISLFSRLEFQHFYLWESVDFIIYDDFIDISLFLLIHIIVGANIFFISFYQCIEIVRINNRAHNAKNQPHTLLTTGYYSTVRHPMTSRFMLIIFSFFFMFASLIAIFFIAFFTLIFSLITLYEEKKILYPIFKDKYEEYCEQVKNRFFTLKLKILISILITFLVLGIFFM